MGIRYLNGASLTVRLPPGAVHPRVEISAELCILAARVRRAFPLSEPERFISLLDGAGKEIGVLRSLDELDAEARAIFQKELDRRYFTPRILHIEHLRQDGGMWRFRVQSQHGPAQFYVRNWRDSSHEIAQGRFQITSVDGQRFEIEDYESLDERSKALLDQLF
jgi:hypothetical protein